MKRIRAAILGVAGALVTAIGVGTWIIAMGESREVTDGRALYSSNCASCHGVKLEGQPDWQTPRLDGRYPAPPQDSRGHTWHHSDEVLVGIIQDGLKPYAGQNYESDMPAFRNSLTEQQIRHILAFIKNSWPERERDFQTQVSRQAR